MTCNQQAVDVGSSVVKSLRPEYTFDKSSDWLLVKLHVPKGPRGPTVGAGDRLSKNSIVRSRRASIESQCILPVALRKVEGRIVTRQMDYQMIRLLVVGAAEFVATVPCINKCHISGLTHDPKGTAHSKVKLGIAPKRSDRAI